MAPHVRVLNYEATELVDPYVRYLDYFEAYIYTPEEYRRDRNEFNWDSAAIEVSYKAAQRHFSAIARDQNEILTRRHDVAIFEGCVKQFLHLDTFKLSFHETQHEKYFWFANRVFIDWKDSFSLHLETMMKALRSAQVQGFSIQTIEVYGFYAGLGKNHTDLLALASECLMGISKIKLVDSFSLLHFLAGIHLESLQQIDLVNCGLIVSDLDKFIQRQKVSLKTVRLERVLVYGGAGPLSPHLRLLESALSQLSYSHRGLLSSREITMEILT
ncbi:hypothetical protein N7468_000751 [Penicillium chermesinum]|uniref:Uncharacterized protein n=1 Tax=Penicillium chermesinum TaxID=63820 RepID=A0A9W9PKX6_9EURO|nr:uncharacterized protein N7468_000751 [Penicillium chermesinum]KAJ5249300.1 hypothetical protein N7468_000751 [Penicillium chermesinum]KAJ6160261.1 hypothetical protein N7470_004869 [Penicillium chermesinum]